MTDERFDICIKKILSGNRDGLKEIYEAYISYIFAIMMGMVKDRNDAEDLTCDFFLKLWQSAGSYHAGKGHKTWIATIARNLAIDFLRKAQKEYPAEQEELPEEPSKGLTPEEAVVGRLSFQEAVDLLGDPDRLIVTLKIAGEMTFQEIAEVLHLPMGTVTWKYQSSLKKLREAMA